MKLVIIESPYAGKSKWRLVAFLQRMTHRRYARRALRDCLLHGEAPIASHLLYTQRGVLRDWIDTERQHGIDAGLAWHKASNVTTVVFTDYGTSRGMSYGIEAAKAAGSPVEFRAIGRNSP